MKQILIRLGIAIVAIILLVIAFARVISLKEENVRLKGNQETLLTEYEHVMSENQKYKVSDSLNAVRVSELEFSLKEYKQYRSEDLRLINQLKTKKSDLQKIITSQSETINALTAKLTDSTRVDSVTYKIDTLKCFNYNSKWSDVSGCIDLKRDTIDLQISNRESLKVVETVTYKRFLGFLWKTCKVKSRQVNVVSENPNTEIVNCEYISIKR